MAKRKSLRKIVKEDEKEIEELKKFHYCKLVVMKLGVVAFVLFLLSVWPWLSNGLLGVHWGIYLAITLLLVIISMFTHCKKK